MSNKKNLSFPREYVRCNLCGADSTTLWGTKDGIPIVRCRQCGLVYANPRLDKEQRREYYNATYFSSNNYDIEPERGRMYEQEINEIKSLIGTSGRFLDVGCAYGRFLSYLPQGFEKYGVEFSEEAAVQGRKQFGIDIRVGDLSEIAFADNYFDVVQFRGVFEHLPDPQSNLEASYRILKPGGWLVLSTIPNIDGPCGILFRERHKLVYPQEHIYYFSRKLLTAYCGKNNFRVVHIRYPYYGTPYENVWSDTISFVLNYFRGAESPPFFRNVITVYAQKQ